MMIYRRPTWRRPVVEVKRASQYLIEYNRDRWIYWIIVGPITIRWYGGFKK